MGGDQLTATGIAAVIDALRTGAIDAAIRHAEGIPPDELHEALVVEAFDHRSLACYGVYAGMILADESAELHVSASELLSLALNVYTGAYPLAFFHAQRAVALDPDDISYKEHLLSFHNNPEHLLSPDEARRVGARTAGA